MKPKFWEELRVPPEGKFRLSKWDPRATPGARAKEAARARAARNLARIDELQYLLYAENRRGLLLVFQAMDCGGKDGAIRSLAGGLNPQGCHVHSFKAPGVEERAHDFLWRIHRATPARGEIAVWNRSHYEDVLIVRVHELVPKALWSKRYDEIRDFERLLVAEGTLIVKFFLHISKDEQAERLRARLEDPGKLWKFAPGDLEERQHWDSYQAAYEEALARTSTEEAPWFVIPADRKWYRDLAVSEIVRATLERAKPEHPKPTFDPKSFTIV